MSADKSTFMKSIQSIDLELSSYGVNTARFLTNGFYFKSRKWIEKYICPLIDGDEEARSIVFNYPPSKWGQISLYFLIPLFGLWPIRNACWLITDYRLYTLNFYSILGFSLFFRARAFLWQDIKGFHIGKGDFSARMAIKNMTGKSYKIKTTRAQATHFYNLILLLHEDLHGENARPLEMQFFFHDSFKDLVKNRGHKINVHYYQEKNLIECSCTCEQGAYMLCAHMKAIIEGHKTAIISGDTVMLPFLAKIYQNCEISIGLGNHSGDSA